MSVKLLTEHYLEFLRLKGGCTCSSQSTLVKMPHCWKSHVTAHMFWLGNRKNNFHYILISDIVVYCTDLLHFKKNFLLNKCHESNLIKLVEK